MQSSAAFREEEEKTVVEGFANLSLPLLVAIAQVHCVPAESSTKDARPTLEYYSHPLSLQNKHKIKSFFELLFAFPSLGF